MTEFYLRLNSMGFVKCTTMTMRPQKTQRNHRKIYEFSLRKKSGQHNGAVSRVHNSCYCCVANWKRLSFWSAPFRFRHANPKQFFISRIEIMKKKITNERTTDHAAKVELLRMQGKSTTIPAKNSIVLCTRCGRHAYEFKLHLFFLCLILIIFFFVNYVFYAQKH